jgi:hypothetical protein
MHVGLWVVPTYCAELWVCRVIVTLMRYFTCIDSLFIFLIYT